METHLIQSNELFGPRDRQEELLEVWKRNEGLFDHYTDFQGRPNVTELLGLFKPNVVNVLTNSDVFFDAEALVHFRFLGECRAMDVKPKCWALSRWDLLLDGSVSHHAHCDSADTWVMYGVPPAMDIPWPLGIPGIDNRLAHELIAAGFDVLNPSKTVKTFHLHNSQYRSYIQGGIGAGRGSRKMQRVPPPYAMVHPTSLA
jgi:hypothetical protein